jgi:predicted TIM-barrel fold metal-dependent hydrolase
MPRTTLYIDANVWLGSWPFQYFHDDTASRLESMLEAEGVGHALVCSPEAVFNPDTAGANRILARRLAGHRRLHPVMALNPVLSNWRELLAEYREAGVVAVRLMPSFHGYSLDSTVVLELVEELTRPRSPALTLQIRMEDKRTQHPRCVVPGVEIDELVSLARRFPRLEILALCAYRSEAARLGAETTNELMDLSHIESMRTVLSILSSVPAERLLLGSHAPFLYARSAVLKLEAPGVVPQALKAIGRANAERLFGRTLRGS